MRTALIILSLFLYSCSKAQTGMFPVVVTVVNTSGTHYYVSTSGSNSNTGTQASPYQTITFINTKTFVPGDTISFNGGETFTGNLVLNQSGTIGLPIVVNSYGTGQATISAGDGNGIQFLNNEYVTADNLKIQGSGVSTADGSTTSTGSGVVATSTATSGAKLNSITVKNCTILGFGKCGVLLEANAGSYPQSSWRGYQNASITGNDISDCGVAGIFTWAETNNATQIGTGLFPQLATSNSIHAGIYVASNNVHDMYGFNSSVNYQSNRSGAGIRICNMNGGTIESNIVNNAGHAGNSFQSPANFESEASNALVWQFNESSNCRMTGTNDGAGMDVFDGGASNGIVQYNYIHDNDGYGIGGGGVGSGFDNGSTQNNIVRFNVLSNNNMLNNGGDVQFWGGMNNLKFYNNTIYSSRSSSYMLRFNAAVVGYFANNIFVSTGTRQLLLASSTTPTFANNLYWRGSSGANLGLQIGGTTYNTLSAWQAMGQETVSGTTYGVVGDPLFLSAGNTTTFLPTNPVSNQTAYDLGTGSPAKLAGHAMSALGITEGNTDFHLTTFSNLSIGAVQY